MVTGDRNPSINFIGVDRGCHPHRNRPSRKKLVRSRVLRHHYYIQDREGCEALTIEVATFPPAQPMIAHDKIRGGVAQPVKRDKRLRHLSTCRPTDRNMGPCRYITPTGILYAYTSL